MGSFIGHAIPGTFFCMFALWWAVRLFMRYYQSLTRNGNPFSSSVTFPIQTARCGKVNFDAIVVIAMALIGIFVEIIAACILRNMPIGVTNQQHATMYFFFGLMGVVALIAPRINLFSNPEDIVYASLVLAYLGEAVLFKFHLFGREDIDVLVHVLLLYTAYACVLTALAEMRFRCNVLGGLARAYFTFLQGTWFWQVGFFLYNPIGESWGSDSHDHSDNNQPKIDEHLLHNWKMLITCIFAWHMAAIFGLFLIVGALVGLHYKKKGDLDENKISQRQYAANSGYSVVSNQDDA